MPRDYFFKVMREINISILRYYHLFNGKSDAEAFS